MREEEVGATHPSLGKVDPTAPNPTPLPGGALLRHSSFVRAVCVNALVRICAGAACEGRPYRDRNTRGSRRVLSRDPVTIIPVGTIVFMEHFPSPSGPKVTTVSIVHFWLPAAADGRLDEAPRIISRGLRCVWTR